MIIFVISLICALICFYIGWKRRVRPGYCFLLGLLLGPLAFIVVFFLKSDLPAKQK